MAEDADNARAYQIVQDWQNRPEIQVLQSEGQELIAAIAAALADVRTAEKERCAAIADYWGKGNWRVEIKGRSRFTIYDIQNNINVTGREIAKDIRSGDKPERAE